MDDGTVFVSIEYLRIARSLGSPAALAAIIDHEAAHFEALVSKEGWTGFDSGQYRAYARQEKTGAAIGLEESEREWAKSQRKKHAGLAYFRELWPGYRAGPASDDYPYRKDKDLKENLETWKGAQGVLAKIRAEREDLNARLETRRQGAPDEGLRDSLNESRHSCGGEGWWAGDVYIPVLPCPDTVRGPMPSPAPPHALTATPPAVAFPAPLQPPPVVEAFNPWKTLNDLARRGCADPGSVTQWELDDRWRGLVSIPYNPQAADSMGLSGCQRDLFLRLMRMAADGNPPRLAADIFAQAASAARSPASIPDFEEPSNGPAILTCRFHPWCREWRP